VTGPAATGCCPYCGAEYAVTEARCWDCRLALEEVQPPTLPVDQPDDEVLYELDDWPVEARVKLTATLAERDVPARWEPGLTLAVRESDDEAAENILDELEEELGDEGWDELEAAGDGEGDGDVSSATEAVAQAAMADLFVAADRLMHEPAEKGIAAELAELAAIVEGNPPPFGIAEGMWDKVRELSAVVRGDLDAGADDEVIAQDARTLRDVLRPYV
jgi:hypothetical protein